MKQTDDRQGRASCLVANARKALDQAGGIAQLAKKMEANVGSVYNWLRGGCWGYRVKKEGPLTNLAAYLGYEDVEFLFTTVPEGYQKGLPGEGRQRKLHQTEISEDKLVDVQTMLDIHKEIQEVGGLSRVKEALDLVESLITRAGSYRRLVEAVQSLELFTNE